MLEIPDVIVVKPGVIFRSAMHMSIQRVMIGLASVMAWFLASPAVSWAIELPAGPLANLKAEAFLKRESAQAELLAWARGHPELAMDELFRYSKVADDPEVRERCLAVLHELVNDEYQKEGEGFIGIRMLEEIANVPGDPNPRSVIRVLQVMPDTAAQQAGLQPNDLIAGLGDLVWREGGVTLLFGEKIRQFKPHTKVTLKVLRNGNLMDLEVILGKRPLSANNPFLDPQQMDPAAAEKAAKDAYFRRWLERRKSPK
jgi:hypothetical protein